MINGIANGWIKKVKPGSYTLGKKIEMAATNHQGYEVQRLTKGAGWVGISPVFNLRNTAQIYCDTIRDEDPYSEFRVYEAVEFPVRKQRAK